MYPLLVLIWAVLALIGWRVVRRFGWRGEVVFLTVVTLQGTLRDYFEAGQALGMIALTPGLTTVLVDIVCWAGLTALAGGDVAGRRPGRGGSAGASAAGAGRTKRCT
jgi:hypothetical protein